MATYKKITNLLFKGQPVYAQSATTGTAKYDVIPDWTYSGSAIYAQPAATPVAQYVLTLTSPANNASVSGNLTVAGTGPGFKNVEVLDASSAKVASATPDASGKFTMTIDTTKFANGAVAWTVSGWDSAAGTAFTKTASTPLNLTIANKVVTPTYKLALTTPAANDSVKGTVKFTGSAPGFKNVEVWDSSSYKIASVSPDASGAFSMDVDTTKLMSGATTVTINAWDSAAGSSFTNSATMSLVLNVTNPVSTGTAGGSNSSSTRTYLVGMYDNGSSIKSGESYSKYLGYHPDFTIGNSYQVHSPGGLYYMQNYPCIIDIDINLAFGSGGYAALANGSSLDNQVATSIKSAQYKDLIYAARIDSEWNLNSANFVGADTYKRAFDKVVSIAKSILPSRVKYVFNPNILVPGPNHDVGSYTPNSCDIIGIDAYANPTYGGSNSTSYVNYLMTTQDGGLNYWTSIGKQMGKPMALPEFGDDYGDGVWIKAVQQWADDPANNVVYIAYWDSPDNENASLRNAPGGSYGAFKAAFANRKYTGTYFQPIIPITNVLSGY